MAWSSRKPSAQSSRAPREMLVLTIVILRAEECDEDVGICAGILLVPGLDGH